MMLRLPRTEKPDIGIALDWANPLNDGLVLEMPFNEGAGGTVYDLSGNGNDGTLSGPTWVPGKDGPALGFDGGNDLVDCGDIGALDGVSQFTISVWVRFKSLTDYDGIIAKGENGTGSRTTLALGGPSVGANTSFASNVDNGSNTFGYTATGLATIGLYQHVVAVFDGSQSGNADRLKIYLDGIQRPLTFNGVIPATTATNAEALEIGYEQGTRYLDGFVSTVSIYNRALTAAEIQQHYQNTWQRYEPRLLPYAAVVAGISMPLVMQQMNHFDGGTAL